MSTQQAPPPRKRQARTATVVRVSRVTPHMIRLVLGGESMKGFTAGEFTDTYIKLLFPPPGATYTHPFDVDQVQAERPREQWPVTRTYTVRAWDASTDELTIDVVHHGEEGLAGPWAASARPGDVISFFGPGGAYAPDPAADWHLFIGDESALPAIAAALEKVPAGVPARAFLEVEDTSEHQHFETVADIEITWVHRSGVSDADEGLVGAVRAATFPGGGVQAFVHGDAGFVKEIRHYLRFEREVPREALSVSGYWRRGRTEEGWRADKPQWNREVEADEEKLTHAG